MSLPKEQAIKIRVPSALKTTVTQLADARFTSESQIVREALLEYLQRRGLVAGGPAALHDAPSSNPPPDPLSPAAQAAIEFLDAAGTAAKSESPTPSPEVTYRAPRRSKKKRPAAT